MKKCRKILSLMIVLIMAMSLSITALAEEGTTYTITINETTKDYTYEAYQVFKGELYDGKLSNIAWGEGVNGAALLQALTVELKDGAANPEYIEAFKNCTSAADIADVLGMDEHNEEDSELAKAFAAVVGNYLATVAGTSHYDDSNNFYTINVTGDGYYFIKNQDDTVPNNASYTRYLLAVVDNVTIEHKGEVASVEKKIIETEGDVGNEANSASIGDMVTYKITGYIPENIADYNTYYYVFTDTLSKGLTYNGAVKVTINDIDVTKYFYINADTSGEDTIITVGISDLLALNNFGTGEEANISIDASTEIVITYTATLDDDAVIAEGGNVNNVKLDYSNNPNESGEGATQPPTENPAEKPTPENPTGETPPQEVSTYTTALTIKKVDGNMNSLTGASFSIEGGSANGVVLKKEAAVDGNGELTFEGLGAGTYTITETVTPSGYNSIEPIVFEINFDSDTIDFSIVPEKNTIQFVESTEKSNTFEITIQNNAGSTLPSTGGIGTAIFYIVGGALVLVAVVLLVTKKRMKDE